MTILKVILAVATLSSMACAQQATSEDLTLAASKGKRHISQLDPYGSLQFHRPPLPSIDYYGESDKGHGGYIVLSHEKGKGHKSKGKGGGGYGYDTGYSNGYAVGGNGGEGGSSESHGNGDGSFGGSYYVAKIKGKGKGGYPSKGKGGSYGGKGKGGYGKGKGSSYGKGKGKGSFGGKGKGGSYGGKGKGGSYGGKGQGGIPYGSGGYNPYGGGSSENNGNGGYLYVSGAISNSYGSSGIGGTLHESGGIGGNSHGSSGIEGNSYGSSGIEGNSYGSGGIEGNSYGSTGIGYNSFGSSQSGGSSSENSGEVLNAYGGGGSQANFYAGGGTQDSAYGGGGVVDNYGGGGIADNYGLGGIDGSYAGGGVGDSYGGGVVDEPYGGGGIDDSYGIGGTDDLYGGVGVEDSFGIGGVDDSYGGGGVDTSYGGGGVDDSFGGVSDSYGTGGVDDSYGGKGGGGDVYAHRGSGVTGSGGSGEVGIPETSAMFTRDADSGKNTGGSSGTRGGTSSTGVSQSLGGGGGIAERTGKKRSPPDTDENADKLSESNATKSNKFERKANTNNDSESKAKTTVNYNLSINANGDASAANGNGNKNTVKVDIKTDGKAKNAFSVSVHISSGGNGNSRSVKNYAFPKSPPIVIQPSSVEEVDNKPIADDKVTYSGGSSLGTKRSIAPVSKANQEIFANGEKSKKESTSTPEVIKEQVKDNKSAKLILPVNNPIKFKAPDGNPGKSDASEIIPNIPSPPSSTSAKPGSPSSIPGGNVKIENVPQQIKGRNETRTNRTTTPLPLKNTAGSSAKRNATEEQSSIGCTSGCFSIQPVPSIRGQANNSTKSNSSINGTPGRIRKGREHVTTNERKKVHSPTSDGSTSNSGKSSTSKDVPKGKVQAEVTSGIAIKGSNASGNTGKDRMRSIGSTASFINITEGGNGGFESVHHLKNGGGRRNVGTANSTRIQKHTGTPTIDDIHSFFGFGGNVNKDLESPRSAHKNETKSSTTSSSNITARPVARHNLRPRPTTVTPDTTSSAGIKMESTKGFGIGKTVPTTGGKRNATFPIDVRMNTTRQAITQRPRPTVIDVPLWIAGRDHRGLDTIGNGTKGRLKTINGPNESPMQFSRYSPTYNPTPVTEDELSFLENVPTNAGKDHRGQVRSTASVRDERPGAKGNSNPSVEAPMIVPFLPVNTYYIPLRRFIRQKQTQRP